MFGYSSRPSDMPNMIRAPDLSLYHRIEPLRELSREHTFFLSLKAGAFERPISEPATLNLSLDPQELKFVVL
jgi:hypothetical protein